MKMLIPSFSDEIELGIRLMTFVLFLISRILSPMFSFLSINVCPLSEHIVPMMSRIIERERKNNSHEKQH